MKFSQQRCARLSAAMALKRRLQTFRNAPMQEHRATRNSHDLMSAMGVHPASLALVPPEVLALISNIVDVERLPRLAEYKNAAELTSERFKYIVGASVTTIIFAVFRS